MKIMRSLSMTDAVSGSEIYVISKLFPELIEKYRPQNMPLIDAMGNVTLFRKGKSPAKTAAVIAHTDEAGFIVTGITEKGFIKFEAVGDIDPRLIISKKVKIGSSGLKGVIGMKAIHLQKREERETVVQMKNLFIDIGAKNKAAAQKLVNIGDCISFDTEFGELCEGVIKGKALDRMGVYCLTQAIAEEPEYDTYYIFTAQKHVGARGASAALERIRPDYVYIIDAVETAEGYGAKPHEINARLGGGAVIGMMDMRGIYDKELFSQLRDSAASDNIKVQVMQTVPAFTETGAVRSSYGGARAAVIGIPCRYANSPVSLMNISDIDAAAGLIKKLIVGLE